jgi:hypothetical protein
MRRLAFALLSLCALLPPPVWAQSTLNKCIDARGDVTYSNLPCKNAREARKIEVDPAPPGPSASPKPAAAPKAPKPAAPPAPPATLRLDTQRSSGKPVSHASDQQCDSLSDKLGRLLDKMDEARRKGYSQEQMNTWNEEVRELERKKRQSGCF